MVFSMSHGQRCVIDAMVDSISWSAGATAALIASILWQAMERRSHSKSFEPRPTFCVGSVNDGDIKLPWLTALHCRCSRHFVGAAFDG